MRPQPAMNRLQIARAVLGFLAAVAIELAIPRPGRPA